jgi:NodT family efflux transporter outer membrane factor (OMF) lipoprotein
MTREVGYVSLGGKMNLVVRVQRAALAAAAGIMLALGGCTSFRDYVHNDFKVGPDYCKPAAPVAEHWIDQNEVHAEANPEVLCHWWTVFNDPTLNELVAIAYRQNLTLREAGFRVLQARAQRAIAVGGLFPQTQDAFGDYRRLGGAGVPFSNLWDFGFNLQWELDFWGKFRRQIIEFDRRLDASVEDYDNVMVTMLGDIASNYVQIRTDQERIRLAQYNIDNVQLEIVRRTRLRAGLDLQSGKKRPGSGLVTEADADVAESTLRQTEAGITQLQIDLRQAQNHLCILLGMPPEDLSKILGIAPIPTPPAELVIGIPADLVRRRPDVREAERLAAAQAEAIGIALAQLYPAFSINGTMGYDAQNFADLFRSSAFNGSVGPSFRWDLLNYGRIVNNARLQDATFQELVVTYQQTVLQAHREVEDGLVAFLQAQRRTRQLEEAVIAQAKAVDIAKARYMQGFGGVGGAFGAGEASFTTYTLYEQSLLQQQDLSAQARGQIAQGMITVYRSLGGGWELRLNADQAPAATLQAPIAPAEKPAENIPAPTPNSLPPAPQPPQPPSAEPQPAQPPAMPLPIFEQPVAPQK